MTTATTLLAALSAPWFSPDNPLFERFVKQPAEQALAEVVRRAPTLGSALLVLFALWLVARAVRAVTARLLKLSKLDPLIQDTWLGRILSGLGDGLTPSKAIASLLYLAILMMAIAAAADILGLTAVKNAMTAALGYVPRLVSALCVL